MRLRRVHATDDVRSQLACQEVRRSTCKVFGGLAATDHSAEQRARGERVAGSSRKRMLAPMCCTGSHDANEHVARMARLLGAQSGRLLEHEHVPPPCPLCLSVPPRELASWLWLRPAVCRTTSACISVVKVPLC